MIIKERVRNVVRAGELGPTQVVKAVQARIPNRFASDDFQRMENLRCPAADQLAAPGADRREVPRRLRATALVRISR
ncbi:hypothetical protein AB0L64_05085 [Kribbella sp. NPDC051936]|uniref:hypothetical protein n=1 Tax=Kribbella sp. NPDC051936 TaxID=3154946 RepID=UPI0034283C0B